MHAIYVEKRPEHAQSAQSLLSDLQETLSLPQLTGLRILQRYFVAGLNDEQFEQASELILSEPFCEVSHPSLNLTKGEIAFAIEFLPGQFDQRADSAAQCIAILTGEERPTVTSAQVYVLTGELTNEQIESIKSYLINPVDSHEASLEIPKTLTPPIVDPAPVAILEGFNTHSESSLANLRNELGLAMTLADLTHTQAYFQNDEKRDPTLTEIRLLDTYWSDHCRHTTFLTKIDKVTFDKGTEVIEKTYQDYRDTREALYGRDTTRPETMMDLAIIVAKELKKSGELDNLELSEEINAASIIVEVPIQNEDGERSEEWLIQFKNETHNHPTEIEPFGGAATCLGGCIRDPLSGRAYVYQAMRVTGAWDPRTPFSETLPSKLPQRKICLGAAKGYSSYGNQIGLATGQVSEIYHPGYLAKRMEIGAVVSACPRSQVQRGTPAAGDAILLIGGRTGRDGVGGATGSSKEHTDTALENSAEVQKGNAPTERKIQRLFRNPELSYKIKRCNDFGAGGVSVAIGELADSLEINLDAVPKKYQGLDGTELAISESQERMAIVVDPTDIPYFIAESDNENLECVHVAQVTDSGRLIMTWRGQTIVSLTRDFIETNGVQQSTQIHIASASSSLPEEPETLTKETLLSHLGSLNHASQKGLGEMFDSSIGAGTILSPFGGKNQITPPDAMVARVPVLDGETDACTHMSWAFDPQLSAASPFHGSVHAVAESVCKLVATGARLQDTRLTFQEYFPKLGNDPTRWGLPFAALLGAFHAQQGLRLAAIGGKDSMSGSFKDLDVPPTLVSFALAPGKVSHVISPEFKATGSTLSLVTAPTDEEGLPIYESLLFLAEQLHELVKNEALLSLKYLGQAGLAHALSTSCLGNNIGAIVEADTPLARAPYSFLIEHTHELPENFLTIGVTTVEPSLTLNHETLSLTDIATAYTSPLESVYPTTSATAKDLTPVSFPEVTVAKNITVAPREKTAKPKVIIPVFPGTNCEYDTAQVFTQAGAETEILVFRNLTPSAVEESLQALAKSIKQSQILMLPGGFSSGDEPDGSAKFIATILRNTRIADAIANLHDTRQGLILGICNGFQALVKSGLLGPDMTLTHNPIARHISTYVTTRIANTNSPWLSHCQVGELHQIPVSHGEGRFLATPEVLESLITNGQIATQYVDPSSRPTPLEPFNPNQSALAIEGITSPDGRILGKMGHTERHGPDIAKNIPGEKHQALFKAGVDYFC